MATTTANLVTAQQLSNWAQQHMHTTQLTADQWCWIMNNGFPAAKGSCSGLDSATLKCCGGTVNAHGQFTNRNALPKITADQFLSCLLNSQSAAVAANQGPGGSQQTPANTAPPVSAAPAPTGGGGTTTPPAQGVLGLTNCSICQQFSSNPILLVILAVAIWYFFFDKD